MADSEVVRRILVEGRTRGVSEVVAELQKMQAAYEDTAASAPKTERATLSVANALEREKRALDEAYRSQRQFEASRDNIVRGRQQGLISQAEETRLLELAVTRYNSYGAAANQGARASQQFSQSAGLVRHEMVNLSRQVQDVGVQLAGGQNPLLILAQQGPQIADIFATSSGSVRGFFGQVASVLTPVRLLTAGVLGLGGAALYMGASFASAQRDVDRALAGQGAASGLSRGGINRIAAGAASPTGLSVSEAREAASAFAATGKLYEDNVRSATLITKQFAQAMGVDAAEATKRLAVDLQDPVKAALEWNKTLGFLDARTLDHIQSLISMGQRQQAVSALISAATPAIGRAAEFTNKWAVAWDFVANKASNAGDAVGRAIARGAENATGINFGGYEDQERLARLQQQRSARAAGPFAGGLDAAAIRALDQEIARLEQRLAGLAKQGESVRFANLSLEARDFGRSIDGTTAQVERLTEGLANIARYQAARLNQGLGVDPALERQAQIGALLLSQAMEQQAADQRRAQYAGELALKYQGITTETAKQLEQLEAQLPVAQATTGAAQIEAQHHATIVALRGQEKSLSEATLIADKQRALALAQATASAEQNLKALQQQGELLRASSDWERDRIKAAQTYANVLASTKNSELASKTAAQELSNARQAAGVAAQREAEASQDAFYASEGMAQSLMDAAERANMIAFDLREAYRWAALTRDLGVPDWVDGQFQSNQGGPSQFNPQGYKFTTAMPFSATASTPVSLSQLVAQTGSVAGAVEQMLSQGALLYKSEQLPSNNPNFPVTYGAPTLDTQRLSELERAISTLSDGQQISATQALIAQLQQGPASIERDEALQQLQTQLQQLTNATDKNTSATEAQTAVLSPLWSSDPRTTKLGFRAFADGGITTRPTMSLTSENYQAEAIIPLRDLPKLLPPAPANSNGSAASSAANVNYYIDNSMVVNGAGGRDALNQAKQTRHQGLRQLQRMIGKG